MSGYKVVKNRWAELAAQMKAAISEAVQDTALDMAVEAQANSPVESGAFRGSIEPMVIDPTHVKVVSDVPEAIFLEYGTGEKASGQPVEGSLSHRSDWGGMPPQPTFTPATENQRGNWDSRLRSVGDKVH